MVKFIDFFVVLALCSGCGPALMAQGNPVSGSPQASIPLLEDVLQMVIKQAKTRVSIQPKA